MSPTSSAASKQKTRQVWTPEEDHVLSEAVRAETPAHGPISWHKVASHLPGRNNKDCRKRWHYSIINTIRKGTWTKDEDQKLKAAVEVYGARWSKIAEAVGTRNGDQCWKRWYDCLDPSIDKSPWTSDEDARLLHQVSKSGRNWSEIVHKHFPNRTSLSAKNRYSILQRKQENASKSSSKKSAITYSTASSPSPGPSLNYLSPPSIASSSTSTPEPESYPEWFINSGNSQPSNMDFGSLDQGYSQPGGWYQGGAMSTSHSPSPQLGGAGLEWTTTGSSDKTWSSPDMSIMQSYSPAPPTLLPQQSLGFPELDYSQTRQPPQQQMYEQLSAVDGSLSGYNMLGIYQTDALVYEQSEQPVMGFTQPIGYGGGQCW
ncbi:hypothetical protein QC763_116130 [Podospora pseudopauciseta]|uniref:Uncharacterized protein n=1 Tax=Podospora pseudopauciseta TaxID=2093780 RepID=A0ABR0I198_9PEZI|nr:hypothetical protein QC763_116130 [Podospora pseudopauciseta]